MTKQVQYGYPEKQGLYDPANEKENCGVGFVAHIKGERNHQIVLDAYDILLAMDHRGACGCESNTGDGAGIMTALPHEFLARVAKDELGVELPEAGKFGAGIVFLPTDEQERAKCKETVERIIQEQGQTLVGWRTVPVDPEGADVGPTALSAMPHIEQLIIAAGEGLEGDAFERKL